MENESYQQPPTAGQEDELPPLDVSWNFLLHTKYDLLRMMVSRDKSRCLWLSRFPSRNSEPSPHAKPSLSASPVSTTSIPPDAFTTLPLLSAQDTFLSVVLRIDIETVTTATAVFDILEQYTHRSAKENRACHPEEQLDLSE